MSKIPTDSRMDFDYSVSTENRFALRNWLERFVEAVNYNDRPVYAAMLSPVLMVGGFNDFAMDKEAFLRFIHAPTKQNVIRVLRLPELRIKFSKGKYLVNGRLEQFHDGILSYEGNIELIILQAEEQFILEKMVFYPRLKIAIMQ